MPVITVTMGPSSKAKKKELIKKLTATASEVTDIPATSFTVLITELEYENIGVGGRTIEEIRAAKT